MIFSKKKNNKSPSSELMKNGVANRLSLTTPATIDFNKGEKRFCSKNDVRTLRDEI